MLRLRSMIGMGGAALAALGLAACGSSPGNDNPAIIGSSTSTPAVTWAAPANATAAVTAAGLHMLSTEGQVEHIHVHLDVIVNGSHIVVPAGIGIDEAAHQLSPVHTHDTSGIIHVESPTPTTYTLGEFFSEWAQPLTSTNLGPIQATASEQIRVYVNGALYPGNPANIPLVAHEEIAALAGPPGTLPTPPSSYQFPAGL